MEDTSGAPNFCTNCGTQLPVGAVFCSSCGTRLSGLDAGVSVLGPDHGGGPVFVQFLGTGVQALGYGLLAGILMILIIPYGWGVSILAGWYVKNLAFSDGRTANFTGRGSQIWGYFILMIVLGILLSLIPIIGNIIAWLLSLRIQLAITRWFFSHIHLSAGKNLRFEGSYWPFFGWNFLWTVSFITIIGWAWVLRQGCAGSAEMLTWGRNTWSSLGAVWISCGAV